MLEIRDLTVSIGPHTIVDIEALDVIPGQRLGIVGESGSGKTMTATSIVGLQPPEAVVTGSVRYDGQDLSSLDSTELAAVRGSSIGFIFQDPAKALNPMMRIGKQVSEAINLHMDLPKDQVRERVLELLNHVQLPEPEAMLRRYPHQMSGGQQQRVLIAIAIACNPRLLIADEPTTALDVTVQNDILDLIRDLSRERNMSLLFVSHDLGVIKSITDTVAVVYGGHLIEYGPTHEVINNPKHRYTAALVAANPGIAENDQLGDIVNQQLDVIAGSVPALGRFPSGCRFRGRCGAEIDACKAPPPITPLGDGRTYKCWNPVETAIEVGGSSDVTH